MSRLPPPPEIAPLDTPERFEAPAWPEREAARLAFSRLRKRLTGKEKKPFIADDDLARALKGRFDRRFPAPLCEPVIDEIEATLGDWSRDPEPDQWLQVVVLPPLDENALLTRWAERHGHTLLAAPPRSALLDHNAPQALSSSEDGVFEGNPLEGEGVLVIAQLEYWFLRHRSGLWRVRALFEALGAAERHCVIGCSSWAYAFLCRAAEAHLILPAPRTFKPFDETRLYRWMAPLIEAHADPGTRFRLAQNGQDVMALDEKGHPREDHFKTLAARSRGIPWVAWHLWQRSLRTATRGQKREEADTETGSESAEEKAPTLWVVTPEALSIPGQSETEALLILHALLIHGALDREALSLTLPDPGLHGMLHALTRDGFIRAEAGHYRVLPTAYPAVRSALVEKGFPVDVY